MGKRFTITLATTASCALAVAAMAVAAEKPAVVVVGKLVLTFNGGFTPKQLPKDKQAGIKFNISGKIETDDKSHPPALQEFVFEADKNSGINAKGLPVCTSGKLQAQDTKHAEAICKAAIVGTGTTDVEVEFPESTPFTAHSKLLAFNGGVAGGTTTIFIHAFLTAPVSAAVVTTVKITKVHNGRYGTKSVATIPKIAGGYGSATAFTLNFGRTFTYKGKKQDYLLLKCTDGRILAKGTAVFSDGTRATAGVVRPCTPKG